MVDDGGRGRARGAVVLLSLVASATGAAGQEVRTVRADGPPAWGEAPRLVEELRIGRLDGADHEVLDEVGGVAVTADGTIWIADEQLGAIRRYGEDGSYRGQVGRKGEGPGEFERLAGLRALPDDSVAVWDDGLRRVSVFGADGAFVRSFMPPTNVMIRGETSTFEVDVGGRFHVLTTDLGTLSREQLARGASARLMWIRMAGDGEVIDTVVAEPTEAEGTIDRIHTVTVVSPLGYRVVGRNTRYAFDLEVAPGRTVTIERSFDPVPYQREERAEKQRLEEVFVSRNGRPMRRIPEHKPPFAGLRVDREGRIWVRVYAAGVHEPETPGEEAARERGCAFFGATTAECAAGIRTWRDPAVFEIIEPDGRFLGRLSFPNRLTEVAVARGDRVWVVETGELGEQYVVRYRVAPSAVPVPADRHGR